MLGVLNGCQKTAVAGCVVELHCGSARVYPCSYPHVSLRECLAVPCPDQADVAACAAVCLVSEIAALEAATDAAHRIHALPQSWILEARQQ